MWFDFCLRRYFLEHSYHDGGLLNHILDDGKLVNHSETPNAGAGDGLLHSGVHDEIDDDDSMTVTVVVVVKEIALILRPKYNTGSEPFSTFAVRDIEKGEEVTNIIQVSTLHLSNICIL